MTYLLPISRYRSHHIVTRHLPHMICRSATGSPSPSVVIGTPPPELPLPAGVMSLRPSRIMSLVPESVGVLLLAERVFRSGRARGTNEHALRGFPAQPFRLLRWWRVDMTILDLVAQFHSI